MDVADKVFSRIDEHWQRQVEFLQSLGRFKSTLGNESAIQRFIGQTFTEMGLETDMIIPDHKKLSAHPAYSPVEWSYDGRPVVVGKWNTQGPKTGKSLILQGHIDVVSPEPLRLWDFDPWSATIIGNKMYGRGIYDMKAGVAAMIYAVKAIKEIGIELGADLLLETVYEEECSGNGALPTLIAGYTADGCLIPKSVGGRALKSQVGVIWLRVRITGAAAHVDRATQGVNAIEKAYLLIDALKAYREMINQRIKHPDFVHVEQPLHVNIGSISSGDWASTVPADCVFEARIGFYPGQDPEDIKNEVKEWLLKAAQMDPWLKDMDPEITFFGFHAHGASFRTSSPLFKMLEKSHKKISKKDLELVSNTGTTDARFYDLFYDIPTTCYGPAGDQLHAPNEWVDLDSVKECTKVYADFIMNWCGVR